MDTPPVGIVTGNVVVVVIPEGSCGCAKVGIEDVFVVAVTKTLKVVFG
jgi:hypothetical protein